jgi:hypothetical protein
MDSDEAARIARTAGLTRYMEQHPAQLEAALKSAADLARRLPRDFAPTEECAHVLRLGGKPEASS